MKIFDFSPNFKVCYMNITEWRGSHISRQITQKFATEITEEINKSVGDLLKIK